MDLVGSMTNRRAMIAMSGGVDSSVAAYLAMQAGHECSGATMRLLSERVQQAGHQGVGSNYVLRDNLSVSSHKEDAHFFTRSNETNNAKSGPGDFHISGAGAQDIHDAEAVCEKLGIVHQVLDFSDTFAQQVVEPFVACYERGWTPNPCVYCNRQLKFGCLMEAATEQGFSHTATGHYARVGYDADSERYLLKRGLDVKKDQSYVLYSLAQEQLARTLLPLGELSKDEVRTIAREQGFLAAEKRESQDICFVPDGDYASFLNRYTGKHPSSGDIVDKNGRFLGRHSGIVNYTIGQRKGLGIAAGHPQYVCEIDVATDKIIVGSEQDLYHTTAIVADINLIATTAFEAQTRLTAKHRYRTAEQPATVCQLNNSTLEVSFDQPQKAITCGQAMVLYDGDVVVGGGTITDVF
jgi:tRNA-specific 2-thiouridylase